MSKWTEAGFPNVMFADQYGVSAALLEAANTGYYKWGFVAHATDRLASKGEQFRVLLDNIVARIRWAVDIAGAPWDHRLTEKGLSSFDSARYRWTWETMCDFCGGDPSPEFWRFEPQWSARRALIVYKMLNLLAHQLEAVSVDTGALYRDEEWSSEEGGLVASERLSYSWIVYSLEMWDYEIVRRTTPIEPMWIDHNLVRKDFVLREPETVVAYYYYSHDGGVYATGTRSFVISGSADIGLIAELATAPQPEDAEVLKSKKGNFYRRAYIMPEFYTIYRATVVDIEYYDSPEIWRDIK